MATKSGEIMWVHPDIINAEQMEFSKPKLKDKLCNTISLATDDDTVTIASLSDSEEEKLALAARPATSQPVGTRSEKLYLCQYDQTPRRDTIANNVRNNCTSPGLGTTPAVGRREVKGGLIR